MLHQHASAGPDLMQHFPANMQQKGCLTNSCGAPHELVKQPFCCIFARKCCFSMHQQGQTWCSIFVQICIRFELHCVQCGMKRIHFMLACPPYPSKVGKTFWDVKPMILIGRGCSFNGFSKTSWVGGTPSKVLTYFHACLTISRAGSL